MRRSKEFHLRSRGAKNSEIAIIGMACRFPGASDYAEFWDNLKNGVNSIREIPNDRWDIDTYYSPDIREPNKSVSKWCGLLEGIDLFDNRFFNISPREVNNMDPQQRLLLEETWHCIEDAGLPPETLQTRTTSVYTGFMTMDYHQEAVAPGILTESYACLGNYGSLLANRISYYFGLHGQSMAIDAACASSLVALHSARSSLLSGESDYALVGAVNLNLHPWKYISFSKARMLSPDGQCKTFDTHANGYVPGDGVGVLLLQRRDDALREGSHIYGLIKGTAVNHGGRTDSITAPRVEAQRDVIAAAFKDAGFSAETVNYIEAHGTGTSLGDPIEIEALTQAFRAYTNKKRFCKIGAVKTNIGHLEAAAGMAGLIKVLLMMLHRQIPPTLNITSINPIINIHETPFEIAANLSVWRSAGKQPLRAGISSFGFGGVNSHVLLEAVPPEKKTGRPGAVRGAPSKDYFILSAKSASSLDGLLKKWKRAAAEGAHSGRQMRDICATLMTGRTHFPWRYGISAQSKREWEEAVGKGPSVFPRETTVESWTMMVGAGDPGLKLIKEECAFLSALMDAGFTPGVITYQGKGFWNALVLSGMIGPEDALAVLSKQKKIDEIRPDRPRIPFYDPVTETTFRRYDISEAYLRYLADGRKEIDGAVDPTYSYYLKKARALKDVQFTFKGYIEEWNAVLQPLGLDVEQALAGDRVLSEDGHTLDDNRLLLFMAVISSLVKLNQKWRLSEERMPAAKLFGELLSLVIDDVLPKAELVELFSPGPDYAKIAARLNKRQHLLDGKKPYTLLKKHCRELQEIPDISAWSKKASVARGAVPHNEAMGYLAFGAVDEQLPRENSVYVPQLENGNADEVFNETLFQLWLKGADIRWEKSCPEGSFRRVAAPGYAFEKKSFWLSRSGNVSPEPGRDVSRHFTTKLSPSEPMIRDHLITGKHIIPGAYMIELASEAVGKALQRPVARFNNIIMKNPGIVEADTEVVVEVLPLNNTFVVKQDGRHLCEGEYV